MGSYIVPVKFQKAHQNYSELVVFPAVNEDIDTNEYETDFEKESEIKTYTNKT